MPIMDNQLLADGVQLLALPDSRFKTAHLTAALLLPLDGQTASEQAILPFLLRRSCAAYPDFTALNKRLNQLYGARVSADVSRIGETQALVLRTVCIDDRFALDGEPVAAQCAGLLRGMLLEPVLENGLFRQADVEQERRCLTEEIESEINEKRLYARHRCEQLLCEGEPYAVNRYGTIDGVNALTPERVTSAWKRMLETARIQLIVQGGDVEAVAEAFRRSFDGLSRQPAALSTQHIPTADGVRERTEEMAVNQCKLVMGFRTGVAEPSGDVAAMRLANALFGATPYSMLFRNVRERLSLCYYCSSSFQSFTGSMAVNSGVEHADAARAEQAILKELADLCTGPITDEEFEDCRRGLLSGMNGIEDSLGGIESWYYIEVLRAGANSAAPIQSPEQARNALRAVTKDEVRDILRRLTLSVSYLLTKEDAAHAAE